MTAFEITPRHALRIGNKFPYSELYPRDRGVLQLLVTSMATGLSDAGVKRIEGGRVSFSALSRGNQWQEFPRPNTTVQDGRCE